MIQNLLPVSQNFFLHFNKARFLHDLIDELNSKQFLRQRHAAVVISCRIKRPAETPVRELIGNIAYKYILFRNLTPPEGLSLPERMIDNFYNTAAAFMH